MQARVRATGLLDAPVVVLYSGGRDSTCLLDLARRIAPEVQALHVDYGSGFAGHCRALCERLGIPLTVVPAGRPEGNFQAWARDVRYAEAARFGRDVATGHTATDQVETVLYRLASSPGRRALAGMRPRRGRVVRPLLAFTRDETAAYCAEHDLPYVEDPSNGSDRFARNRIRHGLLEELKRIHPAAERNVLRTIELLRSDDARALEHLGVPPARVDDVLELGDHGTKALDLGGGRRAVARYGEIAVEHPPAPAALEVPGRVAWGGGEVSAELGDDGLALAGPVQVRGWRPGDRMRPLGLGGTKSLQDLFTDRKVPRDERHRLPVVTSGGEIAWIPGVATGEAFAGGRVRLAWRP
jgi:tRNA(Ile)-lysidine synthase